MAISTTGSIPSLVDYLYGNKGSQASASSATGLSSSSASGGLAGYLNSTSGTDTVSLSSAAQAMMAQNSSSATSTDGGKETKAEAQKFLLQFFQDSGVDVSELSEDAKTLLLGIGDMVTDMENPTHDTKMDGMTSAYVKGQRKSYTLQGTNERVSFTVQYKDGKPASMSVLQIEGTTATQAVISLSKDPNGKLSAINVQNVQKEYTQFGGNISTRTADALALDLYKS